MAIMFYSQYLNYCQLRNKCTQTFRKAFNIQNAPVVVKDLVVLQDYFKQSYGESRAHGNRYKDIEMVPRLIDHIKSLAQLANVYHQKAYCEQLPSGEYQLKEAHKNTITRLSLNEFSLYGKRLLKLHEFTIIVEAIEELMKKSPDNVHLLLSSFSVMNEYGKTLNVTLYVQGGTHVKINTITKALASSVDVTYKGACNFSQQKIGRSTSNVSAFIASNTTKPTVISNNSLLEIETKGGAKFLQAIDVCVDHENAHSRRLLMAKLNTNTIDISSFIPEQVDYIVTSNSIELKDESKISPSVLHIDPCPNMVDRENNTRPRDKSKLNPKELSTISQYPEMRILSTAGKTSVVNPPFGSNYHVIEYQERTLGGFTSDIDLKVKALNKQILNQTIDEYIQANKPDFAVQESHAFENDNAKAYALASAFINQMSKKCKPTFFEFIFRTEQYHLKKKAQHILNNSAKTLNYAKNDMRAIITPWIKDINFKLSLLVDVPNNFINKLHLIAHNASNQILPLEPSLLECGVPLLGE